ncbi:MAG: prephenate dehydrogenase/arogenate dehydrogenase family protein [Candidatus Marinimicrobia bacterium]|nr:prephenate dehydrogenase/arogenate dehydrogenase family protein [Candidatus Neomarinimicrobiota bacterium]
MNKIGIIGFGRFGKILAKMLSAENKIFIHDPNGGNGEYQCLSLLEIVDCEILFIAVPIREFENVIESIQNLDLQNTTIIDVCSVKLHPVKIMEKYLPENVGIIATHPMFGPDSYSPFRELRMVMHPVRDLYNQFDNLKQTFEKQSISIVEMTPDAHDRDAAMSQGITHFIGRVLSESGISSTKINTLGFNELLGVIEQTCNDSWNLFKDLQNYNPYTIEMIEKLEEGIKMVRAQIGEK